MDTRLKVDSDRGAWLTVPQGLFALVADADGSIPYVGCYLGDPEKTHQLPFALSFTKDGELTLQMPNPENPHEPLIVKMSAVVELVKAARNVSK